MVLAIVILGFLYSISLLELQMEIIGARERILDFENEMENEVLGIIFDEGDIKDEIDEKITRAYRTGFYYRNIRSSHSMFRSLSLDYLEEDDIALVKLTGKGRGNFQNKSIEVTFCPSNQIFLNKEGVFEFKKAGDESLREDFWDFRYKLENNFLKGEMPSYNNTVNFINANKDFILYNDEKTKKDYIIDSILDGDRLNYHKDNKKNFIIYLYDTIKDRDDLMKLTIGNDYSDESMELEGLIYMEGDIEIVGDVNFKGLIIINHGDLIFENNASLNVEGGILNLNEDKLIHRKGLNIKYDLKIINKYGVYIPGYIKPDIRNIKIY